LALGFKSVRECQENVSSTEFAEWQAYDLIEPFGMDRFPAYFGTIAATIANVNATKQSQTRQWYDFFPPYAFSKHQTTEEQISIVEMLNEAFGGIDLRGNKTTPTA
jgi:hypothetical protein